MVVTLGVKVVRCWLSGLHRKSYMKKIAVFPDGTGNSQSETISRCFVLVPRSTKDQTISLVTTFADPILEHKVSTLLDSSGRQQPKYENKMKTMWSRERMGIIVIQNDCEEVNNDYSIIFVFRNMSFLRKIIFSEENKFILMI